MIIRDMIIEDYNSIDNLMKKLHKIHVDNRADMYTDIDHPYNKEEFEKMVLDKGIISILAEEDKNIVGLCFVTIKNKSGMIDMTTAYMDDLIVDEEYRNKGIGKKLFEEALKKSKELGAKRLDLMVWEFNKEAIKLYENMGMSVQRFIFEKEL